MAKLSINFWDDQLDYRYFSPDTQPDYRQFLQTEWQELVKKNDLANAFVFSWSLRSVLWPELIKYNALEVRFSHNGLVGEGYGPLIYFGNTLEIKDLPTKSLQNLEGGLILESGFFSESDMFLSDHTDGGGFLGVQSLQIQFLSYDYIEQDEEQEDEEVLYEYTFSADFRITDDQFHQTSWAALSDLEQKEILNNLLDFSLAQLGEYGEYVHDVTDLFAAILAHTQTHPQVTQTLLTKLDELKLSQLSDIHGIHNT